MNVSELLPARVYGNHTINTEINLFPDVITSPMGVVAKYCDEYIRACVCLSVRKNISGTTRAIFTNFFVHVANGRGSVLLRHSCNMLCTSGFVDGIMFFPIMGHIAV